MAHFCLTILLAIAAVTNLDGGAKAAAVDFERKILEKPVRNYGATQLAQRYPGFGAPRGLPTFRPPVVRPPAIQNQNLQRNLMQQNQLRRQQAGDQLRATREKMEQARQQARAAQQRIVLQRQQAIIANDNLRQKQVNDNKLARDSLSATVAAGAATTAVTIPAPLQAKLDKLKSSFNVKAAAKADSPQTKTDNAPTASGGGSHNNAGPTTAGGGNGGNGAGRTPPGGGTTPPNTPQTGLTRSFSDAAVGVNVGKQSEGGASAPEGILRPVFKDAALGKLKALSGLPKSIGNSKALAPAVRAADRDGNITFPGGPLKEIWRRNVDPDPPPTPPDKKDDGDGGGDDKRPNQLPGPAPGFN
ncbi:MAG: hypothetical protein WBP38_15410 [Hyphomicrobium sp.]